MMYRLQTTPDQTLYVVYLSVDIDVDLYYLSFHLKDLFSLDLSGPRVSRL